MAKRKTGKQDDADKPAKKRGRYARFMLWVFQNKEPDECTGELLLSQADLRQAAAALGEEARDFPDLPYYLRSRSVLRPEMIEAGYTPMAIRGSGQYALVMGEDRIEVPAATPVVDISTAAIPDAIRDILRADEQSILVNTLGTQAVRGSLSYLAGVVEQCAAIGRPVHLDLAGEVGHRVGLDPDAGDAALLALHQRGARPAKRVKNQLVRPDTEALQVIAH